MLRGIESAAKGMLGIMDLNDVIANNLANVNSTGFKESKLAFKNIRDEMVNSITPASTGSEPIQIGSLSVGSVTDSSVIDFKQGGLRETGNPLDFAIDGGGFFTVRMPDGSSAYTRNGTFKISNDGTLVTLNGQPVLSKDIVNNKTIKLDLTKDKEKEITMSSNGVLSVGNKEIARLDIVDFKDKVNMKSLGNSLYAPTDTTKNPPVEANDFQIVQGSLESSNSNIIQTMVNSISAMRAYETLTTIIDTENKTLDKNINQVGRLKQ